MRSPFPRTPVAVISNKHDALVLPSRLKIERAKKHVNDLNIAIDNFLVEHPFELWSRFKKKPSERAIFVKQNKPIPDEIPLILGDAVHNLKSALDILAWRMVGDKAPNPKRVLFPFADTEEGLKGSIGNRQTALAGEKVVRTIKELKPYLGGNKYLYGVQTLDTSDKHHFIITTAQVTQITADDFGLMGIAGIAGPGILSFDVPIGEALLRQPIGGTRNERRSLRPFEQKENFQPSFKICFGPEQGFDGQPVVQTLLLMVETVANAIEKIGAAFFEES